MRESGENCVKYLKRRWNRREGRGKENFKKGGGKLGQGVGVLKKKKGGGGGGGGWNPLTNYD